MSARPVMINRSGPAFASGASNTTNPDRVAMKRAKAEGPVIEMTAHARDGGHYWGWYPATPEGLICAGSAFAQLKGYGYRHPPVCAIGGQVIPQEQIEVAVVVPFCRNEARRRAAALLRTFAEG